MKYGYCRVSTVDQSLDLQKDALRKADVQKVFADKGVSGVKRRPQLERMLKGLQAGDEIVIWRLDRLGRSLPDLLRIVSEIEAKGAALKSLSESIDTSTAVGRLLLNVLGSLAAFERDLLGERTRAGIDAARARGQHLGRPPALTPQQVATARKLLAAGETVTSAARTLGVGRSTLYRQL